MKVLYVSRSNGTGIINYEMLELIDGDLELMDEGSMDTDEYPYWKTYNDMHEGADQVYEFDNLSSYRNKQRTK